MPQLDETSEQQLVIKIADSIESPEQAIQSLGGAWTSFANVVQTPEPSPAFPSVTAAQLDDLRSAAMSADPDYAAPRLANYFVVRYRRRPSDVALDAQLTDAVLSLAAVDAAYILRESLALLDPADNVPSEIEPYDPTRLEQTYLEAAPNAPGQAGGIGARHAWNVPGGTGDGITLCDIEDGWVLEHEALAAKQIEHSGENQAFFGHGAAVLGIVAGGGDIGCTQRLPSRQRDHSKLFGVAPCARVVAASVFQTAGIRSVGNALLSVVLNDPFGLLPGDVILIEQQTGVGGVLAPVEADPHVFHAIAQVVRGKGLVVVESAGNGNFNLDDERFEWRATRQHPFNVQHPGFVDSQAIIVAAAMPDGQRDGNSNFGSRVNCFAGGSVATCGDGRNSKSTTTYIANFGDTSAAAAIVAGAAVSLQGMWRATGKPPMGSLDVRRLLSSPEHSTPSAASTEAIGRMPDLRKLAAAVDVQGT